MQVWSFTLSYEGLASLLTSKGFHCVVLHKILTAHFDGHLAEPLENGFIFDSLSCTV